MTHDPHYSETQAKRILARAAAIDSSDPMALRASDLRAIAEAAYIQPEAVDRAIAEIEVAHAPRVRLDSTATLRHGLITVATGVGLGVLAVVADSMSLGPESAAAVFGPSAAYVVYRSLWHRWHGSLRGFAQDAVLALGCFTVAATAVEGAHALAPVGLWSLALAAAGGITASVSLKRVTPTNRALEPL